jgi:hypothetical protein
MKAPEPETVFNLVVLYTPPVITGAEGKLEVYTLADGRRGPGLLSSVFAAAGQRIAQLAVRVASKALPELS